MNLYPDPIAPFRPADFQVKRARLAHEILGHHRLRREAFCLEQRLFADSDRDAVDATAIPIVAISCLLGDPDEVMGAVRIHEPGPGLWWGSRLCVASHLRGAAHLGAELIRFAVRTASAEGCDRFLAHVQLQNVGLFERLHWHRLGERALHGLPHALMQADLAHYPPLDASTIRHLPPVATRPTVERRPN
jgi:putative N-acetyltransferase (TIGR04045 family)